MFGASPNFAIRTIIIKEFVGTDVDARCFVPLINRMQMPRDDTSKEFNTLSGNVSPGLLRKVERPRWKGDFITLSTVSKAVFPRYLTRIDRAKK